MVRNIPASIIDSPPSLGVIACQGLDTRWQIGRTPYELAKLAHARADPVEARDYFSRALTAFEDMGAVPDMKRTKAALESLD